jgi:YfiH family protein
MDPVPHLESGLLARAGFSHAFFTRQGGISEGLFCALNLSPTVGDRAEHVQENLGRVARSLGLRPERLYVAAQPHDRGVILLHGTENADAVARTAADAILSSAPGIGCCVRTADCVPILLADPETGRVGAVHAGWRGLVRHVIASAIERMCELGSRRDALLASFGPHIGPEAFEVADDVASEITSASSAEGVVQRRAAGKAWVSLAQVVRAQLTSAGLDAANIEQVPGCTYRDASQFFSYRRDGQRSGRMLALIVPRAADDGTAQGGPQGVA